MENQHRKISGYRELSEEEINLINEIKDKAQEVGELVDRLSQTNMTHPRWVSIGMTHLQQGFMALTRSVANPDFF